MRFLIYTCLAFAFHSYVYSQSGSQGYKLDSLSLFEVANHPFPFGDCFYLHQTHRKDSSLKKEVRKDGNGHIQIITYNRNQKLRKTKYRKGMIMSQRPPCNSAYLPTYPEKIKVEILLNKKIIASFDSLKIQISLNNTTSDTIEMFFDKYKFHTGGLWYEYAFELTNVKNISMLVSSNKAMLASTNIGFKSKEEQKKYLYHIPPSQSITKYFPLSELITTKSLVEGEYKLILYHNSSRSNIEKFTFQK